MYERNINMGITKSTSKPSVIKSDQTVDEINMESQKRLEHRRLSDIRKHDYLFGGPKQLKAPHRRIVVVVKADQRPRYVYK